MHFDFYVFSKITGKRQRAAIFSSNFYFFLKPETPIPQEEFTLPVTKSCLRGILRASEKLF